ncbi:hypothetical protein SAMN04487909_13054 [Aneurinibacillus migulanus]|uniref:Uncharacterized protein n=1 Tax=Aneurinibacillus migulanus TaxID=47500 RepID=A0A1G8X5Y3_ANEMI|nr:hypothetical protein SAMN04487909_13054 [Aneurinibacillus migulanus]
MSLMRLSRSTIRTALFFMFFSIATISSLMYSSFIFIIPTIIITNSWFIFKNYFDIILIWQQGTFYLILIMFDNIIYNNQATDWGRYLTRCLNVIKKLFIALILAFSICGTIISEAKSLTEVEVFDVSKRKVVKTIPNTDQIQKEVRLCIKSIHELSPRADLNFKTGMIYKIPIEPSMQVENQLFHSLVNEVYLIIQNEPERPLLLLFDDENKIFLTHFKYEIRPFLLKNTL